MPITVWVNTLMPEQNGRNKMADIFSLHFTQETILTCIFLKEKFCILIWISLEFVAMGTFHYRSALVLVMAWYQTGTKPLPEPMFTMFHDTLWNHEATMKWCNTCQVKYMPITSWVSPGLTHHRVGLWSITSSFHGNFYVPRIHKFIK